MNMMKMARAAAGAVVCSAGLLGGCAVSPPSSQAMTPETIQTNKQHPHSVSVTTADMKGQTSTDSPLANALVASIEKTKVFSKVIKGAQVDYQLTVTIMTVDLPAFATDITAKTELAWSLKRADGAAVWQDVIKTQGKAAAGEAFVGVERSRIAFERAVRDNVAQGLAKISNLTL